MRVLIYMKARLQKVTRDYAAELSMGAVVIVVVVGYASAGLWLLSQPAAF